MASAGAAGPPVRRRTVRRSCARPRGGARCAAPPATYRRTTGTEVGSPSHSLLRSQPRAGSVEVKLIHAAGRGGGDQFPELVAADLPRQTGQLPAQLAGDVGRLQVAVVLLGEPAMDALVVARLEANQA